VGNPPGRRSSAHWQKSFFLGALQRNETLHGRYDGSPSQLPIGPSRSRCWQHGQHRDGVEAVGAKETVAHIDRGIQPRSGDAAPGAARGSSWRSPREEAESALPLETSVFGTPSTLKPGSLICGLPTIRERVFVGAKGVHMLRKVSALVASVGLPLSLIAVFGGSASASGAKPPPVDATNYTVSCANFAGVMQFRPRIWGTSGPFTGNVKGKVETCTAVPNGGGTPIDIASGKVTGPLTFELTNDQSACSAMLGDPNGTIYPTSGTLTIAWKTAKKTPALSSGNTVIQPTNLITHSGGGSDELSIPGSPGGVSSTGSFEGTDGGDSDSFAFGVESTNTVFQQCYTHPGITHLSFEGDPLDLG